MATSMVIAIFWPRLLLYIDASLNENGVVKDY